MRVLDLREMLQRRYDAYFYRVIIGFSFLFSWSFVTSAVIWGYAALLKEGLFSLCGHLPLSESPTINFQIVIARPPLVFARFSLQHGCPAWLLAVELSDLVGNSMWFDIKFTNLKARKQNYQSNDDAGKIWS